MPIVIIILSKNHNFNCGMDIKELQGKQKSLISCIKIILIFEIYLLIFSKVPKKRDTIRRNTSITTESPALVYRNIR